MRFYPGVSMITLGVGDVRRASAFYERLGWTRSKRFSNPRISFFALNTIVLALYPRDALAEDSGFSGDAGIADSAFSGVTLAQNFGAPAAVDAAMKEALDAGALQLVSPCPTHWGGYHGVFADPDGHVWELAYNPFVPAGPDGSLTLEP